MLKPTVLGASRGILGTVSDVRLKSNVLAVTNDLVPRHTLSYGAIESIELLVV